MKNDLISRSALLKNRTRMTEYDESVCGVHVFVVKEEDILEAPSVDAEPVRLDEAAQSKWISTEERLPDKPGDVLICLFGKSCVAYYHKNRCFETRSGVVWWSKKDVTHWMPLPEPPKEGT